MGDRHNIGIIQQTWGDAHPQGILWLYSHSGFWVDNPQIDGYAACLALALDEARPRWDDHTYFNRIIIHTLGESVRGIGVGKATGDEHKRYVLNSDAKTVGLYDNYPWDGSLGSMPEPLVTFSFEDFITKYRKHGKTVRNEY